MNELMIHVERIVRPINAIQKRKLRMRMDLLAHLQASLEEERQRFPHDELKAIEQAKLRLGDPAELTQALQQTVPLVERRLLTRLPLSSHLEHVEQRMASVPGQNGAMTLGHKTILAALASLAFAQLVISLLNALASSEMQVAHYALALIGIPLGWWALVFASSLFVFGVASGKQRVDWTGTLKRGTTVCAVQCALMFFLFFAIADRAPTLREISTCAIITPLTLALSFLCAHRIGTLRRHYDEWLTLDIAE